MRKCFGPILGCNFLLCAIVLSEPNSWALDGKPLCGIALICSGLTITQDSQLLSRFHSLKVWVQGLTHC